jgi:hypothetical protein
MVYRFPLPILLLFADFYFNDPDKHHLYYFGEMAGDLLFNQE